MRVSEANSAPVVATLAEPSMIASSDLQAIGGMLAMFKGKAPADLHSALAAEGLSYDTNAAPLVVEAGAGILVGINFANQMLGRLPKPWMDVVLGSYLLHAWLGEKQTPALARQYRIGIRIPGAVMTPSARGLDAMFSNPDMFTAGVAFSRAATLGAQLYDTHKLKLLDELTIARSRDHIRSFYQKEMARLGGFPGDRCCLPRQPRPTAPLGRPG